MAQKIGIMGPPNSGKSFSRSTLTNPEAAVVLMPSVKNTYLKDKEGKPLPRLPKVPEMKAFVEKSEKIPGNWEVMQGINDITTYLQIVSAKMPHVKTAILPDFTHYISKRICTLLGDGG